MEIHFEEMEMYFEEMEMRLQQRDRQLLLKEMRLQAMLPPLLASKTEKTPRVWATLGAFVLTLSARTRLS